MTCGSHYRRLSRGRSFWEAGQRSQAVGRPIVSGVSAKQEASVSADGAAAHWRRDHCPLKGRTTNRSQYGMNVTYWVVILLALIGG